jgi:hypothetical protein
MLASDSRTRRPAPTNPVQQEGERSRPGASPPRRRAGKAPPAVPPVQIELLSSDNDTSSSSPQRLCQLFGDFCRPGFFVGGSSIRVHRLSVTRSVHAPVGPSGLSPPFSFTSRPAIREFRGGARQGGRGAEAKRRVRRRASGCDGGVRHRRARVVSVARGPAFSAPSGQITRVVEVLRGATAVRYSTPDCRPSPKPLDSRVTSDVCAAVGLHPSGRERRVQEPLSHCLK